MSLATLSSVYLGVRGLTLGPLPHTSPGTGLAGKHSPPPKVTAALKRAAGELIYLRFLCSNAIALIPEGVEKKKNACGGV